MQQKKEGRGSCSGGMQYGVNKMAMKIENYEGTANTFTWPYNPQVFDDSTDSNHQLTPIGFQRHHIIVSGGGISAKNLILTGHFSESSMFTNWRSMSAHFMDTTVLKKLYFESDKFHLGVGRQAKRTHSGGRTNFIDYVATFETIIGILFSNTEKTSGTNDGNTKTFVTEITGTITSGASDVVIADAFGNEITIDSAHLTTGHTFEYTLVKMVDSGTGIFVSEYAYVELNGTQTKNVQSTGGFGILQLDVGANITTVTTSNLSTVVKTFRDGYVD